jgi:hypothetical protein
MALRGDFKTGEWTMVVMPAGGDLTSASAIAFQLRGSGCRLRVALDDANSQDWGSDVTAPAAWKSVTLYLSDLVQPTWAVDKEGRPINLAGIQKFKVQPMNPAQGWFEIASIRKVMGAAPQRNSTGLLKLEGGDADSLWTGGGGDWKVVKTIEQGFLRVKYTLGQWCMTGKTGNFKPEGAKGWKFKARGKGVTLRFAVMDAQSRDFGKNISLSGKDTEYTVLFTDLARAPWETKDKDAPLDASSFLQIKLQPTAPSTGEFWISDVEWVK